MKKISGKLRLFASTAALAVTMSSGAAMAESLVLYCSVGEEWCSAMANGFSRATGVDVAMTRKSSGETYAQLKAEASNPKGDVWWGGTGDPHLQAAEEGLTEEYISPMLEKLQPWAVSQATSSGNRTVGIYAGALGFTYNTEVLEDKGLPVPKCWADLIKPEYKGEIQIANPNSSGTAYTALASLVQLLGEDAAFDYQKQLHNNINQYTKSGSAPAKAAARGETGIGINFMHDGVQQRVGGFPVKVIAPCEGTGYEIGSMSIIKGGPNPEAARKWYDWALTAEAQEIGASVKSFQVPSNAGAKVPPEAPSLDTVKLIDYDFKEYGSSATRQRLLSRWDDEIGSLN
ncbi:ABC transporter substrate-binding protein [Rhizobiales bacterium]|uniref:ABC transporter substrate-binding protein n=1 Tax=Hongsoonwoonella zoysiae TaxID=2821844 RepID=UPI00155F70ED|nr:ABC transporter substrate-binding protein [Hongsoonwoonella zoysiae]